MATTTSFDNMLKRYLPYQLLMEEMIKRDYFLNKVKIDNNWKGGDLRVPFLGAKASSWSYGSLTAESDIAEDQHAIGTVSGYKELWGAMVFNDSDLARHGDMKQSFIKILPDKIEMFLKGMKELASLNLMNGAHIVTVTANGDASGNVTVDRPERLALGQYLTDGLATPNAGYIKSINMSTGVINLDTTRAGTTDVDWTANTATVTGAKLYIAGAKSGATVNAFTSYRQQVLSAANGGDTNIFGVAKTAWPYLQAYNEDGSGISATNILSKLFDFWNNSRRIGKGMPSDLVMSYKHLGNVMKAIEVQADYKAVDTKANVYGWTEITIVGVKGQLKIVGINEMDDDVIYAVDWSGVKLFSNGMFERRRSPEGREYYEIRATTGYKYIVDMRFFGELIVDHPSHQGVLHSISY